MRGSLKSPPGSHPSGARPKVDRRARRDHRVIAAPEFRDFVRRRITGDDLLGFQLAFDVTGDPSFPEKPAFEVARELGVAVTTHAGVWGATGDDGIRLMHDHGFMTPETVYVHAASLSADSYHRIAATGRKADARWGRAGARYRIAPLSEAEVRLAPHPALRGSRFGEWRVMPEPHASG